LKKIWIHPDTPVFPLARAWASMKDHWRIVTDGHQACLCPIDEIPAGCGVIHVDPRTPSHEPALDRSVALAALAANDALAAAILRGQR